MLRKVVSTVTTTPNCNLCGPEAFGITDTLECGHKVHVKGSSGFARRRKCRQCDALRGGGSISVGDVEERWNPETQMPIRALRSGDAG
jgi:hypothetical protein